MMDVEIRNTLRNAVVACRRTLEADVRAQLEGTFGIHPNGTIEPIGDMPTLAREPRLTDARAQVEAGVRHFMASDAKPADAVDRFAREVAFTYLNRLAALKMMEARKLIPQSIGARAESRGFKEFAQVAPAVCRSEPDGGYRRYLELMFDEVSAEIRVLFDRRQPTSAIFPRPETLAAVLDRLNDPELAAVWDQDETIGWIYQYFTPEDQRKKARKESQAPRNSYELAFRNQFYTPEYVVRFLTDNTLGRQWYEMRRGDTQLVEQCRYMVRRKHTVFLREGQEPPRPYQPSDGTGDPDLPGEMWTRPNHDLKEIDDILLYGLTVGGYAYVPAHLGVECDDVVRRVEERYHEHGKWAGSFEELRLVLFMKQCGAHHWGYIPEGGWSDEVQALYRAICAQWDLETEFIPYRALQPPRRIKVLDPACGSGHFLLYAFDLLTTMYEEAEPDLTPAEVAASILQHNLHGIDIDPRAVQIACLALYLKARKFAKDAVVGTVNVVCAAPMPGERDLFTRFLADLRSPTLARIAQAMWDEMALAGEMGSLLKPEERLRKVVREQRELYARANQEQQGSLWAEFAEPSQMELDFSDVTDDSFWDRAENDILSVLQQYTEQAGGADATTRRLFAEDSAQGFRFVDLLRHRYDVVLMNPPFGEGIAGAKPILEASYSYGKDDVYTAFVGRGLELLHSGGALGAITSRTGFFLTSFREWRQSILLDTTHVDTVADLGFNVLDSAMVQTAAYVLSRNSGLTTFSTAKRQRRTTTTLQGTNSDDCTPSLFIRLLKDERKDDTLRKVLNKLHAGIIDHRLHPVQQDTFRLLPGAPFPYWVSDAMRQLFDHHPRIEGNVAAIRQGLASSDDFRYVRSTWEIATRARRSDRSWVPFAKGGEYSLYYADIHLVVDWDEKRRTLWGYYGRLTRPSILPANVDYYFRAGLTYPRVTFNFTMRAMPSGCIFSDKGPAVFAHRIAAAYLLGLSNSRLFIFVLHMICEIRRWEVGRVQSFPFIAPPADMVQRVGELAVRCHNYRRDDDRGDETTHAFSAPALLLIASETLAGRMEAALTRFGANAAAVATGGYEIDRLVLNLYNIGPEDHMVIDEELRPHPGAYPDDTARLDEARFRQAYLTKEEVAEEDEGEGVEDEPADEAPRKRRTRARYRGWEDLAHLFRVHPATVERRRAELGLVRPEEAAAEVEILLSYCLGVAFGRWDARIGKDPSLATQLGGAFDELPVCSPGTLTEDAALVGVDGPLPYRPGRLPAAPGHVPADYTLPIQWSGILVDDEGHPDDLVARVRGVLAYLFGPERAPAIEAEAIALLQEGGVKVKGLRDYYATRFFGAHTKRYSKSRRKAPIYWQLTSRRKGYSLWLYYHRLHPSTLYQALQEYVEPKIELEQTRLRELEAQQRASTDSRTVRNLAGQVDKKAALVEELIQFGNDLKEAADRGFAPDLNDGVILNIAPLHKLVPWPDAATAWKELQAGKYAWSTIGQRLAGMRR